MLCVRAQGTRVSLATVVANEDNNNVCKEIGYFALFTFLVGWHTCVVSLPTGDVIFAQLAYPLNDVIFCLHQE